MLGFGTMRLAEAMVGLGETVALGRAGVGPDERVSQAPADLDRDARVVVQLVERAAEQVLGHDPCPAASGQVGVGGGVGRLDGDVHGGVAEVEHDDVLAGEDRAVAVEVRVQLLARERVRAGKRRFGPARVPVVAVGDEQRPVLARLATLERDLPDAVFAPARALDAGLERDPLAQAEVIDVGIEVGPDLRVVGKVGVGGGHREVRVLHARARAVDVQVAIRRGHAVAIAEHPVASDLIGLLEAVERNPALGERLGRHDAGGAGAEDARAKRSRSRPGPSAARGIGLVFNRLAQGSSSVDENHAPLSRRPSLCR
jgi:hypothetical protein